MQENVYIELTRQFNRGQLRAIICSGQAVVLHKLAIMSKDGDWIIREDEDSISHVRGVLASRGAQYRFGAPLDKRWLEGGWSCHLEIQSAFRIRTDFFSRPPRISQETLARIWEVQAHRPLPFIDPPELAEMKKTNREKDYIVIGELSRIMQDPAQQLLYSRSARDIVAIASKQPDIVNQLVEKRPLLRSASRGEEEIARLLDEERRSLIRRNEERLRRHIEAAAKWRAAWPKVSEMIHGLPLEEAHLAMVDAAHGVLPFSVED